MQCRGVWCTCGECNEEEDGNDGGEAGACEQMIAEDVIDVAKLWCQEEQLLEREHLCCGW